MRGGLRDEDETVELHYTKITSYFHIWKKKEYLPQCNDRIWKIMVQFSCLNLVDMTKCETVCASLHGGICTGAKNSTAEVETRAVCV